MTSPTAPVASPRTDGPPSPPVRRSWAAGTGFSHTVLVANLVAQVLIVVTGGIVRLTASGLGCSTWPQCEPGHFTPVRHAEASWHPYIEFGNRTITGLLLVLAGATAWVVWTRRDRSAAYRRLGLVPLALVVLQALVGGVIVRWGLPPALVGLHFLISMALVGVSTALLRRHREADGAPVPLVGARPRLVARVLGPLCALVLVLGVVVTGAGPHSGDDTVGYRLALDPATMARVHSAAVWLYLAGVVTLLLSVRREGAPAGVRRAATVLLGVTLLQGVIGYVQYLTDLPAALVATHMLGASLLVVAQVSAVLSLRRREPAPVV
ncbi:MAG TPA: COX15/CtaA family protein [Actinotalea sp.]